jgi:hypothetical protein
MRASGGTSRMSTGFPVSGHLSCTIAMTPNLRVRGHSGTLAQASIPLRERGCQLAVDEYPTRLGRALERLHCES